MAAVERFKPTNKRRWICDGGSQSLYLVVQPSGHKSWVMRFRRPDGAIAKMVLGGVDLSGRELKGDPVVGQPLSLVAARQLAAAIHRDRARGQDVVADHKARRHRQRAEIKERQEGAFGTLVRKFIEEHAQPKTRQWRSTAIRLGLRYPLDGSEPVVTRGGLVERWSDKPVRRIDGHDVHAVIDEAHRVTVPGVTPHNPGLSEARARGMHAALSSLFGWLLRHRWVDINPCTNVWRPPPSKPRDRTLSPHEIHRLWKACDVIPAPYGAAARLLLLLGARLNEVSAMERGELSADGAIWTIPGSRAKNHKSCVVPLPPLAREIIASVPRISERFVFSCNGHGPITGWSGAKHDLDAAMGGDVPPWRAARSATNRRHRHGRARRPGRCRRARGQSRLRHARRRRRGLQQIRTDAGAARGAGALGAARCRSRRARSGEQGRRYDAAQAGATMRAPDDNKISRIEQACRSAGREPKSTPLGRHKRAHWDRRIARLYANGDDPADVKIVARYLKGEFDRKGRPFYNVFERFGTKGTFKIVREFQREEKCSLRRAIDLARPLLELDDELPPASGSG